MGYCPSMGDNVRERLITILGIIRNNITLSLFFAFALGGGAAYFFLGNLSYVENIKDKTSSDITIESDVSSGGSTEGTIYADIAGAVVSPGVYQLPAGSRFVDLLGEAGGFTFLLIGMLKRVVVMLYKVIAWVAQDRTTPVPTQP